MKTILFLALLGCVPAFSLRAQGVIEWKFSSKKIAEKTYEMHLTALVEDGWHIYSQHTPKGGPMPTKINITKNPLLTLQGKVEEKGDMEEYYDETFGVDVYAYTGKIDFIQVVRLKRNPSALLRTKVIGTLEFMACTDERCLSPKKESFSISIL